MPTPGWLAAVTADFNAWALPGGGMDTVLSAMPNTGNVPVVLMFLSTTDSHRGSALIGGASPSNAKADAYIQSTVVPELDTIVNAGFNGVFLTFNGQVVDDQPQYGSYIVEPNFAIYQYFILGVMREIRARRLYCSLESGGGGFADPCTMAQAFAQIRRGGLWLDANCHPDTITLNAEPSSISQVTMKNISNIKTLFTPNVVRDHWIAWAQARTTSGVATMYEPESIFCGGCMPSDGMGFANAVVQAAASNNGGRGLTGWDTHMFPMVNGCLPPNNQPWKAFIDHGVMANAAGLKYLSTTGVCPLVSAIELCSGITPGNVSQYCYYGRGSTTDAQAMWITSLDRLAQAGNKLSMRTIQPGFFSTTWAFGTPQPSPSPDPATSDTAGWSVPLTAQQASARTNMRSAHPTLTPLGVKMLSLVGGLGSPPTTAPGTPNTPTLNGTATTTTVPIIWTTPDNLATSYTVEYSSDAGVTWHTVAPSPTGKSTVVTGLVINTSYQFRVSGVNLIGTSAASGVLTTSTAATAVLPVITSFTASPATSVANAVSTLTLVGTGFATALVTPGGLDISSGTVDVTPAATTTYTVTLTNSDGSVTATTTVTVQVAPTPTLSASPSTIVFSQASTLSFTAGGADTISIDHGIGDVTGKSTFRVSPVRTTTYTITGVNGAGTGTASATVTVNPPIHGFKLSGWWAKVWDYLKTAWRFQAMDPAATPIVIQIAAGQTANLIEIVEADGVTLRSWLPADFMGAIGGGGGSVTASFLNRSTTNFVVNRSDGNLITTR